MMQNSHLMDNEIQSLNNKISNLNFEIDDLQTKKTELDKELCNTKINVESLIEKIS